MSWAWRTALVTGASSGIGEALARRLAAGGARVGLAARREAELARVADAIRDGGGRADPLPLDVTDGDAAVEGIRAYDARVGGLDLVIANAGVARPRPARELSWEHARPVFATNFVGAMATLTAVLPRMVERDAGHLVGISSVAVYSPTPEGAAYRAAKSGLTAFLENLRAELGASGVRATAVHPGFVRTAIADEFAVQPPFVLGADETARRILRRLPAAPARIDFPWPVVAMMKLMGALPAALRDPLVRRAELSAPAAPLED